MVKSDRQRKRDRAKRRNAAAQRQVRTRRRQLVDQAVKEVERRVALLHDPGTPVEQVAALIQETFGDEPVMPGLAAMLYDDRGSIDDVVAIAEAMRGYEAPDDEGQSLSALTFGAHAAQVACDFTLARRLMDQALQRADEPELMLKLAAHLSFLGRIADSLEIFAAHVAHPAYDEDASATHGYALEDAHRRLFLDAPQGECQRGSGVGWPECCKKREADAIERFLDRSGLYALRTAIVEYLPGSPYDRPVSDRVADWLDIADADSAEPGSRDALQRLAIEHAWIAAPADEGDDDADNILTALAEDRTTPPEIAAAARRWRDHVRYGLWQVIDPTPTPGLWCTEIVTGQELYVAFAPEQIEQLPRWAVLLGAMVPLAGAWRATGSLIQVSPSEANALCETIHTTTEALVSELAGRPDKSAQERARSPCRSAGPSHTMSTRTRKSQLLRGQQW